MMNCWLKVRNVAVGGLGECQKREALEFGRGGTEVGELESRGVGFI